MEDKKYLSEDVIPALKSKVDAAIDAALASINQTLKGLDTGEGV